MVTCLLISASYVKIIITILNWHLKRSVFRQILVMNHNGSQSTFTSEDKRLVILVLNVSWLQGCI